MSSIGEIAIELEAAGLLLKGDQGVPGGSLAYFDQTHGASTASGNEISSLSPSGANANIDLGFGPKGSGNIVPINAPGNPNIGMTGTNNLTLSAIQNSSSPPICNSAIAIGMVTQNTASYTIALGHSSEARSIRSINLCTSTYGSSTSFNGEISFCTGLSYDQAWMFKGGCALLTGLTAPTTDCVLISAVDESSILPPSTVNTLGVKAGSSIPFISFTGLIHAKSQTDPTKIAAWKVEGVIDDNSTPKLIYSSVTALVNTLVASAPVLTGVLDANVTDTNLHITAKAKTGHTVAYFAKLDFLTGL